MKKLGCELPIFAFSHGRDEVVEVTKAGGFGVLCASTFSPAQLDAKLRRIDQHVQGRLFGFALIIPRAYDREAQHNTEGLEKMIPEAHHAFMDKILDDAGVPALPGDEPACIKKSLLVAAT